MNKFREYDRPNKYENYLLKRSNLIYYQYVDYLVRALAADAKSLIDIGSYETQIIENFDWISKRHSLDIQKPYQSEKVVGIKTDFFDFEPEDRYDFAICLQVLEHIPDAKSFARKLFRVADRVLISVPYLWKPSNKPYSGNLDEHVHDPIDLKKLREWTGRDPSYYIMVQEPLVNSLNNKDKRLICYYHSENEKLILREVRQRLKVNSTTDKLDNVDAQLQTEHEIQLLLQEADFKRKIEEVNGEIEAECEREKGLIKKLKIVEAELKNVKVETKKLAQDRNRIERRWIAIQKSRIWRSTLPVRKLAGLIKRVLQIQSVQHHPQVSAQKVLEKPTKLASESLVSVNKKINKEEKYAHRQIERLRRRLLNLGFTERPLADLQKLLTDDTKPYLKRLAAWELSLWYANQYSMAGAQQCLELLSIVVRNENNPARLRQIAVMEAECYEVLGNIDAAKNVLSQALVLEPHADLFLALANLESSVSNRMVWINKAFELYGIFKISYDASSNNPSYDCLRVNLSYIEHMEMPNDAPKVSVIIPAYNADGVIRTALDSVLSQTWTKLEVLVVDDCSTDATVEVVEEYVKRDSRVQLIRAEVNGGPYVARNLALRVASGDFVTCHDADDWSHPEKIERQVQHLLKNPSIVANTSQQARATNDLKFYRRGNPGFYIFNNISSLMFRREPVRESVGYWDCVRFVADGEFIRRVKKVFGAEKVVDLSTGPLSFQRQSRDSLTGDESFGFHGYLMGARKEYFESYNYYHNAADTLRYEFPQKSRPFAVPEPMWPTREAKPYQRRHFDVILASDFRMVGGSTMSNIEEIKAQKRMGLRTGLIQMSRYDFDPRRNVAPQVRELIDGNQVQMLVYGEKVSCDILILRYPPILQEWQRYVPDVETSNVRVIVNQPPMSDYGPDGVVRYDIKRCHQHIQQYFGKSGIWYPIGPLVREALYEHHVDDLAVINLANEDWVNIIDIDEWRCTSRPRRGSIPRIGRHSRDHVVKWPVDKDELLAIYPASKDYEIHVLGGAEIPKKILGRLPKNWHVLEFGEVHPKEFLSKLDVFVYYTHPDWVESFGRVIIEAMAAGVPVILPHSYRKLFGEAAIYAEPSEVKANIVRLMSDVDYYKAHVKMAYSYVERHFGYTKHATRLKTIKSPQLKVPTKAGKTSLTDLQELPRYELTWPNLPEQLKKGLYSFSYQNFDYDFIYSPAVDNRLFVLLSGSVDRRRLDPPVFQRWSWSRYFPGHCLYIADPTIKLHKDMRIAWYVGTRATDILPVIVELIKGVAGSLNIPLQDVIIYASSGGGFAALRLSSFLPEIVTVAINPQIDITQYDNRGVEKFLSQCFDGIDRKNAIVSFPERLSILPSCNKLMNNRIVYVQNTLDEHHYNIHFKLFAEAMGLKEVNNYKMNNIQTIFFEHQKGHRAAETPEIFSVLIETAINIPFSGNKKDNLENVWSL